jgi:hypothetical protein
MRVAAHVASLPKLVRRPPRPRPPRRREKVRRERAATRERTRVSKWESSIGGILGKSERTT